MGYLLLENGDNALLESGDALVLEDYVATVTDPYPGSLTIRESQAIAIREGRRMTGRITYSRNAERPALALWLLDRAGNLIDFSSGYTFAFRIGEIGDSALLVKTTDITGAAGSGTAPTGTPNVLVTWAAGELDIAPGVYLWQLIATTSSLDRVYEGTIVIQSALGASGAGSGPVDEIDGGAP